MKCCKKFLIIFISLTIFIFNSTLASASPLNDYVYPNSTALLDYSGVTTSEVSLTWHPVFRANGYNIYRATSADSNYTLIATVSTQNYKDIELTPGTRYYYFVKAYNSYGVSPDSNHITFVTASPPPAPIAATVSKKQVLGFTTYYSSSDSASYNSMVSNTSALDEIATDTYSTDGLGKLSGSIPYSQLSYANKTGIKSFVMISNSFNGSITKTLLESPANRQTLINNILSAIKTYGYKGVNIDLEAIYSYDRNYLTTFMNELYNTLKPKGYYVTIDVPAKTYDNPFDSWSGAYDYAALAKYSDQIAIMTYDEHYSGGMPGPIASIGWVEKVIKYSVKVIPKEKILLGTSAYGYDWPETGAKAKAYGISQIYSLASTYKTPVIWDSISQTPYFTYIDETGIKHTLWFENAQSLNHKLKLVNSYNLSGIAIWRLGLENKDYWTSIKTQFGR